VPGGPLRRLLALALGDALCVRPSAAEAISYPVSPQLLGSEPVDRTGATAPAVRARGSAEEGDGIQPPGIRPCPRFSVTALAGGASPKDVPVGEPTGPIDLGDGSIVTNPQGGAAIVDGALNLTTEGVGGQAGNWLFFRQVQIGHIAMTRYERGLQDTGNIQ